MPSYRRKLRSRNDKIFVKWQNYIYCIHYITVHFQISNYNIYGVCLCVLPGVGQIPQEEHGYKVFLPGESHKYVIDISRLTFDHIFQQSCFKFITYFERYYIFEDIFKIHQTTILFFLGPKYWMWRILIVYLRYFRKNNFKFSNINFNYKKIFREISTFVFVQTVSVPLICLHGYDRKKFVKW